MHTIDLNQPKQIVASILEKRTIENVCFVGCGASQSELYPASYFLTSTAKKLRVYHYIAAEFNTATPAWLGETTLVISASLGGSTPETVQANAVAKAAGAAIVSLTHAQNSGLAKDADYVIVHGFEENYGAKQEKMGYCLALALEVLQQVEGYDKYDAMIAAFDKIFDLADNSAKIARPAAKAFAQAYKDEPVIYVMSSGATEKVAYSISMFLMMEMQWIPSSYYHSGDFFHGPFELVDKDVPYILLMNDGKTRSVDARALTFLHRFDAKVTVLDAKDFGLSSVVGSDVAHFFNPLLLNAVFRVYAEEISFARNHPLTMRRYMWKLSY